MGKVKKWLAKWSLDDVQKHLATIKNKVKTIANGTASNHEWTRDQATAIIQMINAIEADYRDYKISEVDNSLDRKNAKTWDNTNTHMHKWIDEKSTFNIAA
ncbi:MAG: hypothetical protein LBP53_01105 [Candidatus Peribacteria bacterium]|jgi:hypothetical protein|nr:hypothetical protein [Candidatus Peribacteria bacterium]